MMNNQEFEKYNSIPKEKFAFTVQGEKIHDKKLETKSVSYARDSFRRFCKNKASVVAAIILGILILLALIVPEVTGVDTNKVSASEHFLEPKLFEAGTGFWDGTKKMTHLMYDRDNEVPAGYYKPAVLKLVVDKEPTYINAANQYGKGGYVMFENQASDGKTVNVLYSDTIKLTAAGGYSAAIAFDDTADALGEKLGEYRIILRDADDTETVIELQGWSSNYSNVTLMISSKLAEKGIDKIEKAQLGFELKAAQGVYSYILIESCVFSANETVTDTEALEAVGFSDATAMVLLTQDGLGNFPKGYWTCTGRKGIFQSEVYYCDFVYDTYAAVYDAQEQSLAVSEFDKLIAQGLCEYDPEIGPSSFKKLSDDCPIEEVVDQQLNYITGELLQITVKIERYWLKGYSSMPKFILGTDDNGVDVLTKMFKGLRTSLMLGVATFVICFTFGLVWGAISGYFGGTIDLAMERFTDILVGIPWIIIMTLCILHLGNNFGTFVLALCLTDWVGTASGTRTQFYRFKNMEHVLAARTLGASDWRLIFKHILPNSLGTIITSAVLMIPGVIFSEATLAYLNLGLQGVDSFGVMLSDNQKYIQSHSYLIIIPSVVIALLEISFNLFGNGLRDAVNPTLKGSEG